MCVQILCHSIQQKTYQSISEYHGLNLLTAQKMLRFKTTPVCKCQSRELSNISTSDQTPCKFIHCNSNAKLHIVIRFTRNKIGESPTHSSILLQIEPKFPNNVLNLHTSCHFLCIIYPLLRSVYLYIVH